MRQTLIWLRFEALIILLMAVLILFQFRADYLLPIWAIVLVLAAPDLSIAGYLGGPRAGALIYNLAHSYLVPVGIGFIVALWPSKSVEGFGVSFTVLQIVLLWVVHIAADRLLGFGLKEPSGFKNTHLGRLGR